MADGGIKEKLLTTLVKDGDETFIQGVVAIGIETAATGPYNRGDRLTPTRIGGDL